MRFAVCFLNSVLIFALVAEVTSGQAYDSDADVNASLWSNTLNEQYLADGFHLEGNYLIDQVTWRGIYFSGDPNDPLVDDNFTIQIHGSDNVRPFVDAYSSDNVGAVSRIHTGETLEVNEQVYDIFEYSASISPLGMTTSTRYWLSVSNDSSSPWSWAVEAPTEGADLGEFGVIRHRNSTTSAWDNVTKADAAFTLDGTAVDLSVSTSRWTAGDGYFDNPNNWDTDFSPAYGSFSDERNAIIDADANSPFEIRMRTGADLESLTLDSENASFFVERNTLTLGSLSSRGALNLNNGLFRMGAGSNLNRVAIFDPNGNYRHDSGDPVTSNWNDVEYHGNLKLTDGANLAIDSRSNIIGERLEISNSSLTFWGTIPGPVTRRIGQVNDIVLGNSESTLNNEIRLGTGVNLLINEGVTVSGFGAIKHVETSSSDLDAILRNYGVVHSSSDSGVLSVGSGMARLDNHGTLLSSGNQNSGAQLELLADSNRNYGLLRTVGSTQQNAFLGQTILSNSFENHGEIEVVQNGVLRLIFDSGFVQHSGSLLLEGGQIVNEGDSPLLFEGGGLMGSGRIESSVEFGGTLAIGQSAGRIDVQGDWSFLSTSNAEFEIGGLDSNTESDFLSVDGTLILDGVLAFEMINGFDSLIQSGDSIEIMRGSVLFGEFLNVSNGGLLTSIDGRSSFTVHYGSDSIYDANAVVLSNFVAVPEPSALLMVGVVASVFCTRRRRNQFAHVA